MAMHTVLTLVLSAALVSTASADLLVGQVVDQGGQPVASVNIDATDVVTGFDVPLLNDSSDASGNFAVTIPAGTFDLRLTAPPAAQLAPLEVMGVTVLGTLDVGQLVLSSGVVLSGRILDASLQPIPMVNLDVVDLATGVDLDPSGDHTDAAGAFSVIVPPGQYELQIAPPLAWSPTPAPTALVLDLQQATDLGDVVLPLGYHVTGILLEPGGLPASGNDFDVYDPQTGVKLYTPHDSAQGTGFFDLVLPAGTWDVVADPPKAKKLVSALNVVTLSGAGVNLGVVQLQPGFYLSGLVTSSLSPGEPGVDVDLSDSTLGTNIYISSGDNTGAGGNYQVVVPAGTFDVQFDPPGYAKPLGALQLASVVISGDTVLNGALPDCAFHTLYGLGSAGAGGIAPTLTTVGGTPRAGNSEWRFELSGTVGGSAGLVAVGFGQTALPLYGGTLLVDVFLAPPYYLVSLTGGSPGVPGSGHALVGLPYPIQGDWAGIPIYCQAGVVDPTAVGGVALSNGVAVTFCP